MQKFNSYPIDTHLESIAHLLNECGSVVVSASPGAGKTTRIPIYLKDHINGIILVLEPRRLAAKLSAERSSFFLDDKVGGQVGYQIRYDKKFGPNTKVLFITEGLFVRIMLDNPDLLGIGAVILDEFHERNIHTDIALGLIQKLKKSSRPDLKLIVMSATIDTKAISAYLGNCPIFNVEGKVFNTAIEYLEYTDRPSLSDKVVLAVKEMLSDSRCPGNILVFLSGLAEIKDALSALKRESIDSLVEIVPLYSDLSIKDQAVAFDGAKKKVIISTNIAETSLTLPNITGVIDSGNAKIAGVAPWSGMPTLEVMRISKASCIQRAGRAGRTSEGIVYRLFSKGSYLTREDYSLPDIKRIDLSHMILDLLSLGQSLSEFEWFEKANQENLSASLTLLQYLGAIDTSNSLTHFGRELALLPMHPRLSTIIMSGIYENITEDCVLAACILSEGMISKVKCSDDEYSCDISYQIDILKEYLHNKNSAISHIIDNTKVDRVLSLFKSLQSISRINRVSDKKVDSSKLARVLFRAYPDRIAIKRNLEGRSKRSTMYNFCMGKGGSIWDGSALNFHFPEYFIAIDATEKLRGDAARGITVRYGSKITLDLIYEDPAGLLRSEIKSELNEKKGVLRYFTEVSYGKIIVERKKGAESSSSEEISLYELLKQSWPYPFANDYDLKLYHAKLDLIESAGIDHSFVRLEGEFFDLFLELMSSSVDNINDLLKHPLSYYIEAQLSWGELQFYKTLVPDELKAENGKTFYINYSLDRSPRVESIIQSFYGIRSFPNICENKIALDLVLLSPGGQPAQITCDLFSFWKGSYKAVVQDLSKRYPKHYWPEDPEKCSPFLLKRHLGN